MDNGDVLGDGGLHVIGDPLRGRRLDVHGVGLHRDDEGEVLGRERARAEALDEDRGVDRPAVTAVDDGNGPILDAYGTIHDGQADLLVDLGRERVEALPAHGDGSIDPGAAKPREEAIRDEVAPATDQVRLFGKGLPVDVGADRLGGDAPFVDGPVTAHVRSGHCLVGVCLVDVAVETCAPSAAGDVSLSGKWLCAH